MLLLGIHRCLYLTLLLSGDIIKEMFRVKSIFLLNPTQAVSCYDSSNRLYVEPRGWSLWKTDP